MQFLKFFIDLIAILLIFLDYNTIFEAFKYYSHDIIYFILRKK